MALWRGTGIPFRRPLRKGFLKHSLGQRQNQFAPRYLCLYLCVGNFRYFVEHTLKLADGVNLAEMYIDTASNGIRASIVARDISYLAWRRNFVLGGEDG
jgi:hypothetical protein